MPNAIRIELQVGGVSEIDRAFRTVEQSAMRFEQRTKRGYTEEATGARKAADAKTREEQRWEAQRMRIQLNSAKMAGRMAAQEVKDAERAEAQKVSVEERAARQRQRIQEQTHRAAVRLMEEEVKAAEKASRQIAASREKFAKAVGGHASRTVGGLASGAVNLAGGALALGGGFGMADVVQKMFGLDKASAVVSNMSSSMPGGRIATKDIASRAKAVAIANNVDPTQVVESMGAYFAKASDMKGAMGNAGLFAQLSKATGADMSTIATTAGSLRVQNPNLGEAEMKNMLLGIVGQTRRGAVDIADLAQHVPTITSTSSLYGGDQALNQRKLIGLSQVAMRTSGSSAEAAEAVQRFGSDIASNSGKIQGATGFNVKNKDGSLKDMGEIVAALMQSSKGDIGALKHMGIGRESMKIFEAEEQTFKAAGGGKAGAAAVGKDISQFTEGGYDEKSLAADVANVMQSPAEKFGQATEKLTDKLEERLAPMIEKLADQFDVWEPKVEQLVDTFADALNWLGSHPWEGLGLIVAGSIVKDLAAAGIGSAVKATITTLLGGGGGGGVPGGGGGGGGGPLALGGATALAAWQEGSYSGDVAKKFGADDTTADVTKWSSRITGVLGGPVGIASNYATDLVADALHDDSPTGRKFDRGEKVEGEDFFGAFGERRPPATSDSSNPRDQSAESLLIEQRSMTRILQQIAENTKPSTPAGDPSRNSPHSDKSRGGA
jgi:ElaB/YqjD/DUF883 family membrane-anchored ribosome-binding protein